MKWTQFIPLAIFTLLATYWMNDAILSGQYFWAGLYAVIVVRNLHFSYQVTQAIRLMNGHPKKRG